VGEGPRSDLAAEEVQRFPDDVHDAFEGWAEGREAVLIRDAAYLNWRYVERPGAAFELALVRRAAGPVGWAVLRDGLLFDWGAPLQDEGAVGALLAWARARTRAAGTAGTTNNASLSAQLSSDASPTPATAAARTSTDIVRVCATGSANTARILTVPTVASAPFSSRLSMIRPWRMISM